MPQSLHPKSKVGEGNHVLEAAVSLLLATEGAEFGREEFHLEHHSLFGELSPTYQTMASFSLLSRCLPRNILMYIHIHWYN